LSQAEYDEARVVLKADYMQYAMKVERQTREMMRGAPVAVAAAPEAAAPEAAAPEAQGAEPAARSKRPRNGERPRSGFVVKRNRFVEAVANVNEASQSEEAQWEEATFLHHQKQFDAIEADWLKLEVDWAAEFPQLAPLAVVERDQPAYLFDIIYDLWDLHLAKYYKALIESGKYGFIPHMFLARNGSTLSAGYVERVNSAGKMIYPVGRKSLGLDICEMLVMLRMNETFYKLFEDKYSQLLVEMDAKVDLSAELAKV
jgi:hypothetical protein